MTARALPALAGVPLAAVAGLAVPLQGRVNGALGVRLNDAIGAAVVSFTTGLLLMLVVSFALPAGRASLARILPALRNRAFPRIYVLAGVVGALFVLSQSFTVGIIGVALFTVATVTGQTLSGLVVDSMGIGPAGRKRLTWIRILGCVLTVAAVLLAVSPRLAFASAGTSDGGTAEGGLPALLLVLVLPLLAGFMVSFQQAMNGTTAVHYGSPLAATFLNFLTGAAVLWVAWLIKYAIQGPGNALPGEWWYYVGGPLGCVFIAVGALLVRSLGVLLTGLGMIAGQLVGSLALDLAFPSAGTVVAPATVAGTLLTLLAIILTTLPWPRGAFRRRGPVG